MACFYGLYMTPLYTGPRTPVTGICCVRCGLDRTGLTISHSPVTMTVAQVIYHRHQAFRNMLRDGISVVQV